jgi:hypothetical protein
MENIKPLCLVDQMLTFGMVTEMQILRLLQHLAEVVSNYLAFLSFSRQYQVGTCFIWPGTWIGDCISIRGQFKLVDFWWLM